MTEPCADLSGQYHRRRGRQAVRLIVISGAFSFWTLGGAGLALAEAPEADRPRRREEWRYLIGQTIAAQRAVQARRSARKGWLGRGLRTFPAERAGCSPRTKIHAGTAGHTGITEPGRMPRRQPRRCHMGVAFLE